MLAAASHAVAVLIEAAGSALLVGFVLAAGAALLHGRGLERARLLIAEGAVLALSLACLSIRLVRRFSRALCSASTSMPKRSSKVSDCVTGVRSCCS